MQDALGVVYSIPVFDKVIDIVPAMVTGTVSTEFFRSGQRMQQLGTHQVGRVVTARPAWCCARPPEVRGVPILLSPTRREETRLKGGWSVPCGGHRRASERLRALLSVAKVVRFVRG